MRRATIIAIIAASCVNGCAKKEKMVSIYEGKHDQPIFMAIPRDGAEIVDVRAKAKKLLPKFHQAILDRKYPGAFVNVKGYFPEADGSKGAHLWLMVVERREKGLVCVPFELPSEFTGLKLDHRVLMADTMIEDWMILHDGTLYGGYSLRVQRAHVPEAERKKYDEFIGVSRYSEEEP